MERRYALPERVLPDEILGLPTPPLAVTRRMQVERAVRRARHCERGAHLRLLPRQGQAQDACPAIEELVAAGVSSACA